MKNLIRVILISFSGFLISCIGFFIFMYFFTKPAKPIMEYEFPTMTYEQLEVEIAKISYNKINAKFNVNKKPQFTRTIVLGKDSLQFGFVTREDKDLEYKTKHNHTKESLPWLELWGVCNSKGRFNGLVNKNREEYPELIKLFEDDFIKKINNGKVNVIERGFWDWF
nr:hypothetical protein [uncultured Flavobacterium sp.]